ncbi:integrase core domain-containing protein [Mycolicibacterium sp. Y3]
MTFGLLRLSGKHGDEATSDGGYFGSCRASICSTYSSGHRLPARHRTRRRGQLHRHRTTPRPPGIYPHRQRNRLHQPITNGHNDFERLLATFGITQKNGHPGHPQTQGKIERFHQTLKRWLKARPRPTTIADMQRLLDEFTVIYNTERTHRALPPATTPAQAYHARPKTTPTNNPSQHFRIRHDTVDQFGKLTLRYGSRIHHHVIGKNHASTPCSSPSPTPP